MGCSGPLLSDEELGGALDSERTRRAIAKDAGTIALSEVADAHAIGAGRYGAFRKAGANTSAGGRPRVAREGYRIVRKNEQRTKKAKERDGTDADCRRGGGLRGWNERDVDAVGSLWLQEPDVPPEIALRTRKNVGAEVESERRDVDRDARRELTRGRQGGTAREDYKRKGERKQAAGGHHASEGALVPLPNVWRQWRA